MKQRAPAFLASLQAHPSLGSELGKAHSLLAACQQVPCQVGRDGRTPAQTKGVFGGAAQPCGVAVGAMAPPSQRRLTGSLETRL